LGRTGSFTPLNRGGGLQRKGTGNAGKIGERRGRKRPMGFNQKGPINKYRETLIRQASSNERLFEKREKGGKDAS